MQFMTAVLTAMLKVKGDFLPLLMNSLTLTCLNPFEYRAGEIRRLLQIPLKRVHDLLSKSSRKARWMNCKLVLSFLSQFFHSRLFLSNQAKLRSIT